MSDKAALTGARGRDGGLIGRSARHLGEVGMSYGAHLGVAAGIGGAMIGAGLACLAHGLMPGIFQDNASRTIRRLNAKIGSRPDAVGRDGQTLLEFEI